MARSSSSLLTEIENDVLGATPLADTLRKCIILGGRAGSTDLRDWATRELRGYATDDVVPGFRTITAPMKVDALLGPSQITGQQINSSFLPEFAREHISETLTIRDGVGEIEAHVANAQDQGKGSLHLTLPGSVDLAAYIDGSSGEPFQRITALYWEVSVGRLNGILDHIRTTLTQLIAEMRAAMPRGADVPSAEVADQAFQVAVNGHKSRVVVNVANATHGNADASVGQTDEAGFWTTAHRIWAAVGVAATIAAAVIAWIQL